VNRLYFDANATTPMAAEVIETIARVDTFAWANASSVHEEGRRARAEIEQARRRIAIAVGAGADELIFTGGGTEANITALRSLAFSGAQAGKLHLVVSAVEHPSVLGATQQLEEAEGFECTYLQPDALGRITAEQVLAAVRDDTALVALMAANNEIGNLYPVKEVGELLALRKIPFHVDCVQMLGKEPVDFREIKASTAAFSAHKIHGPKGVGALYVRNSLRLMPFLVGGHQERERRAGTEAVSLIAGFGVATSLMTSSLEDERHRLRGLNQLLWDEVVAKIPGVALNGDPDPAKRLASTLNMSFENTEGETVLIGLDLEGVAASSGSACTAGSLEPSHVLVAMGAAPERARAALRISMHRGTIEEHIPTLVAALEKVVATVREAVPPSACEEGARYG